MTNVPYYEQEDYWSGRMNQRPGFITPPYQDWPINQVKVDYILSQLPQGKVLDIGCAMGYLVRRLRAKGVDAYGVDISSYALEHAPTEVREYLELVDVTQGLPFQNQEYDLVYSTGVFEHFEGEGLSKAISETVRIAKRGIIAITLKGDPGAEEDPNHPTLKTKEEWQALFPEEFEVRSDSNEEWTKVKQIHSVLVISPVLFPSGGDMRYAGIERLAYYWSKELAQREIRVTLVASKGSVAPKSVALISVPQGDFVQGELVAYGAYRHLLLQYDLILDFSHSHLAMREFTLPAVAWCWHTPSLMQPPLPSYNVLALTEYQRQQLAQYQGVMALVLDPHCGVSGELKETDSSYIFIGRATPTKGMLEAAVLCQELGVPLDVVGGLGPGDDPAYLEKVQVACGNGYWGQVPDTLKNVLLAKARALIYPINYPNQQGEAHSHKSVDSLLAGCPVVAYNQGALSEVIEHGVDGFLAQNREEFKAFMLRVEELDRELIQERAAKRWSIEGIVDRAWPLLTEVARGQTW